MIWPFSKYPNVRLISILLLSSYLSIIMFVMRYYYWISIALILFYAESISSQNDLKCDVQGQCFLNGNSLNVTSATNATDCLKKCKKYDCCKWYTFHTSDSSCEFFFDCELDPDPDHCTDCLTGQVACPSGEKLECKIGLSWVRSFIDTVYWQNVDENIQKALDLLQEQC